MKNEKSYVKPITDDQAFNKGVEYFSEVIFFYGILFTLVVYEINHNVQEAKAQRGRVKKVLGTLEDNDKKIESLKTEISEHKVSIV